MPDYNISCASVVISGIPELVKDEEGKKILLKSIEVNNFQCITDCEKFPAPIKQICEKSTDLQTMVTDAIVQLFSSNLYIYKFSGFKSYLIDKMYIENDGLKIKWVNIIMK